MNCIVKFIWDGEAERWFSTSEDIPGLILESSSFDVLLHRVKCAAPEMLELNRNYTGEIHLSIVTEHIEVLAAAS